MIEYVIGDATRPRGTAPKIIAHIVNDAGGWGAGFVVALSRRWTAPEREYRAMKARNLGDVQFVHVEVGLYVANMVAQHGYGSPGQPPIRYDALVECLSKVAEKAREIGASVHGPRFGAGLAGGDWSRIEALIEERLDGIAVVIYDLAT